MIFGIFRLVVLLLSFFSVRNIEYNPCLQIQLQSDLSKTNNPALSEAYTHKFKTQNLEKKLLVFTLLALAIIIMLILVQLADRQRLVLKLRKQHSLIEEKNNLLEEQKKEILLQSQNLEEQKREIIIQAMQLTESNLEIQSVNKELHKAMEEVSQKNDELQHFNNYLDAIVKVRVAELEIKNDQISEYAFVNAHKLRSPLASILGIVALMKLDEKYNNSELVEHLVLATQRMDEVVHEIQAILQEESDRSRYLK